MQKNPTTSKPAKPAKPSAAKSAADTIRAKRKAADAKTISDFQAKQSAALASGQKHYAGLSQAAHKTGSKQPSAAIYLQSYFSGNGHTPATLTPRDETAALMLAQAGGFKSGASVNPATFGGDKSACGVRARGHGFTQAINAAGKPTDNAADATGLIITDFCITTAKRLS